MSQRKPKSLQELGQPQNKTAIDILTILQNIELKVDVMHKDLRNLKTLVIKTALNQAGVTYESRTLKRNDHPGLSSSSAAASAPPQHSNVKYFNP